jgi:hypothetical protein
VKCDFCLQPPDMPGDLVYAWVRDRRQAVKVCRKCVRSFVAAFAQAERHDRDLKREDKDE